MFFLRITSLLLIQFAFFVSSAQHPKVSKADEPEWIAASHADVTAHQPKEEASGFYYLLLENQDHLGNMQSYKRRTYKILSSTGVQDMADITVGFDPEYQQVLLHSLNILRDGEILDKLDLTKMQVVQREANMERFLYDGSLTAIINLTDVRVGDIIDYSFTIVGKNPVHEKKYQQSFFLRFPVPIEQFRYTVIVPNKEKINYKKLYDATDPDITKTGNTTIYTWDAKKVQAFPYEAGIPAWFDPAPAVEISQFSSWKEVVDQYQKHYSLTTQQRESLGKKFSSSVSSSSEEAGSLIPVIRFVQDEVRYLGFENGLNSHRPSFPADVLDRRYGDCKDKSFLLSELLQAEGVKAYPMLVNSVNGRNLINSLPSANVFDHCVVRVELADNEILYIDPTISDQGGNLTNISFPDYGYGLVLKPGVSKLQKLPVPQEPQTKITETFEMDELGGGARLDVETIYRGSSADHRRAQFAGSSRQSVQQDYTSFYSNLYPSIKAEKNLSFRDYRDINEFIVYEQYRIDSMWTRSKEQEHVIFTEFYPLSLQGFLFPDSYADRKMPVYLDPSVNVLHKTQVYLPESWNIRNENSSFGTEDFRYDFAVDYQPNRIEIKHAYKNLNDHIAPENLKSYLAEHTRAQENLSYFLTYDTNIAALGEDDSVSYLAIFFMFLVMGGTAFFCVLIYKNYDLPAQVNLPRPREIGGWLALIGVGLVLTPIIVGYQFFGTGEYFNAATWQVLFSSEETFAAGILMMFEFIYNSAYLIFTILIIVLFFQRRTIAPRMIIWFFAVTLVFSCLDTLLTFRLVGDAFSEAEIQESYLELVKQAIRSAIWIPYFILSARVKETFTRTRSKEEAETDFPGESPVISI